MNNHIGWVMLSANIEAFFLAHELSRKFRLKDRIGDIEAQVDIAVELLSIHPDFMEFDDDILS